MSVRIVVLSQARKGSLSIVDIADDVKIAVDPNGSIVAELERTAALVHEPKFAHWRSGWHLIDGKNSTDNDPLFDIALLRDEEDLVTGLRGAGQSPAVSYPLR